MPKEACEVAVFTYLYLDACPQEAKHKCVYPKLNQVILYKKEKHKEAVKEVPGIPWVCCLIVWLGHGKNEFHQHPEQDSKMYQTQAEALKCISKYAQKY